MSEKCQRCGDEEEDRRTLWMACFYAMEELEIPFEKIKTGEGLKFYTLTVCKDCRASWMKAIKQWWEGEEVRESCGSGIFVREYGANIEITEEEFYKRMNDAREKMGTDAGADKKL